MSAAETTPLEEFLVEPFAPDHEEPEQHPWRIDGIGTAEWVAAKLRRAKREIAARQAEYDAWKARADEWLATQIKPFEHDVQWAEAQLTEWHRTLRAIDDSNKSITLPSGTKLVSRAGQPRITVVDETAFLDWARDAWPALVRTKESPDLVALRKQLKETGEAMPGVAIEPAEISFAVEVDL